MTTPGGRRRWERMDGKSVGEQRMRKAKNVSHTLDVLFPAHLLNC